MSARLKALVGAFHVQHAELALPWPAPDFAASAKLAVRQPGKFL